MKLGNKIDTIYNARTVGKSASFPRVSPNGKYLMYTLSAYGNFSIWHRDADLFMINLDTGKNMNINALNSKETESYHSWSSNSHWIVFSSRRLDGLYTRLYIAHIDNNGNVSKPFLLPQDDVNHYTLLQKSYNIPEFIKGPIKMSPNKIAREARYGETLDIAAR